MAVSMSDFLQEKEIVFIGLSSNPASFSRKVYQEFINGGYKVYAVNERKFKEDGLEVYSSVNEIAEVPETAYILLSKENTKKAVQDLKETGIKKIIFHNKNTFDQEIREECSKMGIETIVACPRMFLSNGLIHKIHGFFAGVKQ